MKLKKYIENAKKFLQADKLLHITACMCIVLCCTLILSIFTGKYAALGISVLIACIASIGKELYDMLNPDTHTADLKDLLANFIGILLAGIPMLFLL